MSKNSHAQSSKPEKIVEFDDIPNVEAVPKKKLLWLVEGLIAKRTITIIAALPGSFKTWLALALAKAVSAGTDFLGRTTKSVPVLYLDRDNPLMVIHDRRKKLGLAGENLKFWGSWISDPPPAIGDPRLQEIAREYSPLIIFDFFRRFHEAEENSAKEMGQVMNVLRQLATAGATVVLLHHSSKSGESFYRGSTDILAGVDVALALSVDRETNPPTLALDCVKHRFTQEFKLKLRFDESMGDFDVISDTVAVEAQKTIRTLKKLITKNPGRLQEWAIERSGLPEYKARSILKAGDGIHWKSERGERKKLHYYPIT